MTKTKKELREELEERVIDISERVAIGIIRPNHAREEFMIVFDQALQAKEEEVVGMIMGLKKEQEFKNIQDIYDNGDSADLAGGGFQIGYNRAIDDILSSLKKGETK